MKVIGNISSVSEQEKEIDISDFEVANVQHAETRETREAILQSHFRGKCT